MTLFITDPNPPITSEMLLGWETILRYKLPTDYKAFLLASNGGRCHDTFVNGTLLQEFYGVGTGFEWNDLIIIRKSLGWLPKDVLAIASTVADDQLCIDLPTGRILLFTQEQIFDAYETIASTFDELITNARFLPDCSDATTDLERLICRDELELEPQVRQRDSLEAGLIYAVNRSRVRALELLLTAGANPNCSDSDGNSALHLATYADCMQSIHLLVRHGASLNIADDEGETPLLVALTGEYVNAATALVHLGADLKAKNKFGQDAVDICKDQPHSYANQYILPLIRKRLTGR